MIRTMSNPIEGSDSYDGTDCFRSTSSFESVPKMSFRKHEKRGSYNGKNSEVDLIAATWIGLMHRPLSLRAVCETSQNNLYRFRLAAYFLTTFVPDFGSGVQPWEAK